MTGIDKEPIDSVSVYDRAYEGKSSILDQVTFFFVIGEITFGFVVY